MSDAKVTFGGADWEPAAPGAEVYFSFACPTHAGRRCEILLIRGRSGGERPSWIWTGGRDKPTFSPSINHEGCWHGYIEDGRCVTTNKVDEPEPVAP